MFIASQESYLEFRLKESYENSKMLHYLQLKYTVWIMSFPNVVSCQMALKILPVYTFRAPGMELISWEPEN